MYSRIIVPLDGSEIAEQVLPYAIALAPALGSEVQLLRAVQGAPPIGFSTRADHERFWAAARANAINEARAYLEKVSAKLQEQGVRATYRTPEEYPAEAIVNAAAVPPSALIAMTTHGRSGPGRWIFGSVADRVLQTAPTPLLLVRAQKQAAVAGKASIRNIVLPLDGSELAETAIPHAVAVAKALDASMTVVRAVVRIADAYGEGYLAAADAQALDEESQTTAQDYLNKAVASLREQGVSDVRAELLWGPPADAIADYTRNVPDRLVVLSTHGWTGLTRLVMGSVANRLVRNSEGPVLIIPPSAR